MIFTARLASLIILLISPAATGLAFGISRRAALAVAFVAPAAAQAALVLNEDGEYEQVEDVDWQTAWKGRLDKAKSMSPDEVFMAARGAGNQDLRDGPESDASMKRRAMAGCRDAGLLKKAGVSDAKECTARVLKGQVDFMLNAL
jgi:hypothetical protein